MSESFTVALISQQIVVNLYEPFCKSISKDLLFYPIILMIILGADKSLARPGRKQAQKHVRDACDFNNIKTRAVIKFFSSCKARHFRKFTAF